MSHRASSLDTIRGPEADPSRVPGKELGRRIRRIAILAPGDRARAWTGALLDALERRFALPVEILRANWGVRSGPPLGSEGLEALLGAPPGLGAWVSTRTFAAADAATWTDALLINATEHDHRTFPAQFREATILSPLFHGLSAAEGFARPLLAGECPHLGVVMSAGGDQALLAGARLASSERAWMGRALDPLFGRLVTLLLVAVDHVLHGRPAPPAVPAPRPLAPLSGADFWWRLAGAAAPRLRRRLAPAAERADRWCVGVRTSSREVSPLQLDLDSTSFEIAHAGVGHYYADPFLLRHEGVTALFFEDYDDRLGRASIAAAVLGEDGRLGPVLPALRRPYHLSYPFVFLHEGAALMVPETRQRGTIELYEAARFPHEWRLRSVLMEGVDASDTTLHFEARAGLWWMFSAVAEFGSSSHDTLSIFYSQRPEGPWLRHAANPVKLDPESSRPAGPLVVWENRLFRPTQDCSRTYGGALVWCEVLRLTPDEFVETPVARQGPGDGFAGLHTYGRSAGWEVVDFKLARANGSTARAPLP